MIIQNLDVLLKNTVSLQEKIGLNIVKQMYYTLCEISETKQEDELTKDLFAHAYIRTLGDHTKPLSNVQLCQFLYSIYNVQGCFLKMFAFGYVEVADGKEVDQFKLTTKGQQLYNKIKLC